MIPDDTKIFNTHLIPRNFDDHESRLRYRPGQDAEPTVGGRHLLYTCPVCKQPWFDILPSRKRRRDSHPHEWAFLLRWRLQSMIVSMFSSYVASTGMTFRKPCGSSQSDVRGNVVIVPSLPPWFSFAVGERECILVEHGSGFTRRTDLRRNPQTLFCYQGTTYIFFHRI